MTFPILGGNGAVAGYSIDNSLRFEDGDSADLRFTPSSSGTSTRKFTFRFWTKFVDVDAKFACIMRQLLIQAGADVFGVIDPQVSQE